MQRYFYSLILIFLFNSCTGDKTDIAHSVKNDKTTYSANKSDINAYNLIDPEIANLLLSENPNNYIPIQVSKEKPFLKEHIPNAKNIWRPDYASDITKPYSGLIPSKEKLQKLLQLLGFEEGKTLLLYDIKANVDALRFAWILNLYGFDDFKVINGGLKNWIKLKLPISNKNPSITDKSNYQLNERFDTSIIANFDDVLSAINDTTTILIDTREDYEFKGMPFVHKGTILPYKKGAFNRGSIPTAIHHNWSTLADLHGDHRIKPEKDLRYDLAKKGISPDKNIILYCHSGSRTSHTFYVLKHILGYPHVKNYDGSWIEWSYKNSQDSTIPIRQICTVRQFEEIYNTLNISLINNE